MALTVAIVKNWRKYNLPHVMCGFVAIGKRSETVSLCFGDGSYIDIAANDRGDLILTDIPASEIPE